MSEQPGSNEPVEPPAEDAGRPSEGYGSLSIEDDPAGTVDPADLAGTAQPDDEPVGYEPAASEADDSSGSSR